MATWCNSHRWVGQQHQRYFQLARSSLRGDGLVPDRRRTPPAARCAAYRLGPSPPSCLPRKRSRWQSRLSGQDGVQVNLPPARGYDMMWLDPDPAGLALVGASMRATALGSVGSISNQPIGTVAITKADLETTCWPAISRPLAPTGRPLKSTAAVTSSLASPAKRDGRRLPAMVL